MRSNTRRGLAIAAASIIALGGASVLTACGGSSDGTASSSAAAPAESEGAGMIGPVILEPGTTSAEVQVGRVVTFNVADPMIWMISTTDEAVFSVTPGGDDGMAQFLPGGEALAPGTSEVTLTNMDNTDEKWVIAITVTQ